MKITVNIITKLSLFIASVTTLQAHLIDIDGTHKSMQIEAYHPRFGLELPIALVIIGLIAYQISAKKRLKKQHFITLILVLTSSFLFV